MLREHLLIIKEATQRPEDLDFLENEFIRGAAMCATLCDRQIELLEKIENKLARAIVL